MLKFLTTISTTCRCRTSRWNGGHIFGARLAQNGTKGTSSEHAKGPRTHAHSQENRTTILESALNVFSTHGFRGATIDQITAKAELSKPNLLYCFPSKEAIRTALLSGLLDVGLAPLHALDKNGDPLEEIPSYIRRKL